VPREPKAVRRMPFANQQERTIQSRRFLVKWPTVFGIELCLDTKLNSQKIFTATDR